MNQVKPGGRAWGCLGLLSLLPLSMLLAFAPTTYSLCPDGSVFVMSANTTCLAVQATTYTGGVVLERIVYWVMSQDWAAALGQDLRVLLVLVCIVLFLLGAVLLMGAAGGDLKGAENESKSAGPGQSE